MYALPTLIGQLPPALPLHTRPLLIEGPNVTEAYDTFILGKCYSKRKNKTKIKKILNKTAWDFFSVFNIVLYIFSYINTNIIQSNSKILVTVT